MALRAGPSTCWAIRITFWPKRPRLQEPAIPAFSIPISILRLCPCLIDSDTDTDNRKTTNFDSDFDTDTKVKQVS